MISDMAPFLGSAAESSDYLYARSRPNVRPCLVCGKWTDRRSGSRARPRGGFDGWLVDDVEHVQPGQLAGVHRRPPPRLVKISRHGDDGLADRAEFSFGVGLQPLQNVCGDGFGRIRAPVDLSVIVLAADVALDAIGHLIRLQRGRGHGLLADNDAVIIEQHDAGRE
jgi:hypothetical protein